MYIHDMHASVPDRRGETWEEKPRPEHQWVPGHDERVERFVVVGEPTLVEGHDPSRVASWCHQVLWMDDIPSLPGDGEDKINENYFTNGMYVRLA